MFFIKLGRYEYLASIEHFGGYSKANFDDVRMTMDVRTICFRNELSAQEILKYIKDDLKVQGELSIVDKVEFA